MMRHTINLLFVFLVTAGLAVLYRWGPHGVYSFRGHGSELRDGLIGLYWLLCTTHVMFAGISWMQRGRWDSVEASTFRFVSVKAILWGFLALTTKQINGIPLAYTYMVIVIALTTLDLDVKMVRRYIMPSDDSPSIG